MKNREKSFGYMNFVSINEQILKKEQRIYNKCMFKQVTWEEMLLWSCKIKLQLLLAVVVV